MVLVLNHATFKDKLWFYGLLHAILKTKAAWSSEMLVSRHHTALHNNPENHIFKGSFYTILLLSD
jgi:hypothetical protein